MSATPKVISGPVGARVLPPISKATAGPSRIPTVAAAAIKTQATETQKLAINARTKSLEKLKPQLVTTYGEQAAAEIIADPSLFTDESLKMSRGDLQTQIYALGNLNRRKALVGLYASDIVKTAFAKIDAKTFAGIKSGAVALDMPLFMNLVESCEAELEANKAVLNQVKAEFIEAFGRPIFDERWAKIPAAITSGKEAITEETLKVLVKACTLELVVCKEPIKEAQIHRLGAFYKKNKALLGPFEVRIGKMLCNLSASLRSGTIRKIDGSSSGVYFATYNDKPCAVIKPEKEEAHTEFCPVRSYKYDEDKPAVDLRGKSGERQMKCGIPSGEASKKEHTSFLIDYAADGNFSDVPVTLMVELDHREPMVKEGEKTTKVCSVQEFIEGSDFGDLSSAEFAQIKKEEWEKLASYHIDAGNLDGHIGNILFTKDGRIIPIDAGFTRGDAQGLHEHTFSWKCIPKLRQDVSATTKAHVANQSIEKHAQYLARLGYSKETIQLEKARMHLKKKAIAAGLNFYDIASIMVAHQPDGRFKDAYCEFQTMYETAAAREDVTFDQAWDDEVNRVIETVKGAKAAMTDYSKRAVLSLVIKDPFLNRLLEDYQRGPAAA